MNDSVLISVIVPSYNAGTYLTQCLDNLICQTYKNIEIIVIDDGSTDDTAQIVNNYSTIKYIYQENRGLSGARNRGIEEASGEYIHFMDADDFVTLDFYEKMIQNIVNSDSDMACCGFYFERFPNQTQRIEYRVVYSKTEDKIKATNVCNYAACWRYILKLSFLKENNLYFELGRLAEDRIFSIQAIYLANRVVMVPDVMYIYKNRDNAITTTRNIKQIKKRHEDRRYADQFQVEYAKKHNFTLDKSLSYQRWQFKMLGIPLLSKKVYHAGRVRWYFFSIPVFQKKEIDL